MPTETPVQSALRALYAQPCKCVRCGTCGGSGNIWVEYLGVDELERCPDDCENGLSEVCDRCMDIEELEREE